MLAKCQEIVEDIFFEEESLQQRFGLVCLAATHFMGTGAALMEKISERKNGPKQTMEEWARAMSDVIAELATKQTSQ